MYFEPKSRDFDGNKPTQAELGLAWLGLPFSKWKQAVQAESSRVKPRQAESSQAAWLGLVKPKSTDFDGLDGLVKRLGLAWLAFFEVETSRVKPRPKPKTKPTQAELGWI